MEQSRKEELLWKYENGKSNLQEEKELKDHFKNNSESSNENLAAVFSYYDLQSKVELNAPINIKKKSTKDVWLGLAASLVMVFGLLFVLLQNKEEVTSDSLVLTASENPEEVLKETQKALALLSVQVNTGLGSVRYLKEYQKSKEKIFRK
jgi:transcription initiation factor TFIIIB Brf1 subunit/transcription initiation factor TFIIB